MPEIKLNDEKVLQMFVDRLIADKGGNKLDAKQKETLQGELLEELDERMQSAMIRALPDAKLMELEGLLDAEASDEEIESFFENAGVSFDEPLKKAMDEFRTDYFAGKIKTSVKTGDVSSVSAEKPAEVQPVDGVTKVEAPVGVAIETQLVSGLAAEQPVQGVTSAMPGQSDVNGVADTVNAVAQGQAPVVQTQTVVQGAQTMPTQAQDSNTQEQTAQAGAQAQAGALTAEQVIARMPAVQPLTQPAGQTGQAQTASSPVTEQAAQAQPMVAQEQVAQAQQAGPAAEAPLHTAPNLMDALNAATANLNAATAGIDTNTNNEMTGKEA